MPRFVILLLVGGAVLSASPVEAQDPLPKAGSWAVEGGFNATPSLLRFRSEQSAWVIGVAAQHLWSRTEIPGAFPGGQSNTNTLEQTTVELRLGIRRYAEPSDRVRRYSTISGIIGWEQGDTFGRGPRVGAAAEIGAAYLVTPRTSVGGAGELNAIYSSTKDGTVSSRNSLTARFSGFKLVGAVYF